MGRGNSDLAACALRAEGRAQGPLPRSPHRNPGPPFQPLPWNPEQQVRALHCLPQTRPMSLPSPLPGCSPSCPENPVGLVFVEDLNTKHSPRQDTEYSRHTRKFPVFLSVPAFNSQTPPYEPDKEDASELEMCVTCRWLVSVSYLLGDRPPWVLADSLPSAHVATDSSKQWAWPGVRLQKTGHKYTMTSPLQWDRTQSQKVVFKGYLN